MKSNLTQHTQKQIIYLSLTNPFHKTLEKSTIAYLLKLNSQKLAF